MKVTAALLVGLVVAVLQLPAEAQTREAPSAELHTRVWTAAGPGASIPKSVTAYDPDVEGRAEAVHYPDSINCTWVGFVLPTDASADLAREQHDRCDAVVGEIRQARSGVEGLVGEPLEKTIELLLLESAIDPEHHDVPAQSTAVRTGTLACYRTPGAESERCTGLPVEAPMNATTWSCQVQISGDIERVGPLVRSSVIAHELFHCDQRSWSPLTATQFNGGYPPWLVEGSASWAGEKIAGGSPESQNWWARELQGTLRSGGADSCPGADPNPPLACVYGLSRGYSAHSFFFALAGAHGDGTVASALRQAFTNASTNDAAEMGYLTTASDPVWIHWAAYARRWSAGGPNWDLRAPGITNAERQQWRRALALGGSRSSLALTAAPTQNRIADITWSEVTTGEQNMTINLNGNAVMRWVDGDDHPVGSEVSTNATTTRLAVCITRRCRAGATRPPDGANRLVVAVAGGPDASSTANVALECPAPIASFGSPVDRLSDPTPVSRCCLVGEWRLVQAPQWSRLSTLAGGTGITIRIDPDGRMVEDFSPMQTWDVKFVDRPDSGTYHMRFDGQVTGTIDLERLVSARRLKNVGVDFSGVTVTASVELAGGVLELGTQPFSEWNSAVVAIAGEPPPDFAVDLTCTAETLQLTETTSSIHYEFQRIGDPVCSGSSCAARGGSA